MPLLKRCLRVIFYVLAEKKLSLLEAQFLINPLQEELRKFLSESIEDEIIKDQWVYFETQTIL